MYLDTSAIVPLYIEEANSDQITALVLQSENKCYTGYLSVIEFNNSIKRKRLNGIINQSQQEKVLDLFESDSYNGYLEIIHTESANLVRECSKLINSSRNKIDRSLDIIHVAINVIKLRACI